MAGRSHSNAQLENIFRAGTAGDRPEDSGGAEFRQYATEKLEAADKSRKERSSRYKYIQRKIEGSMIPPFDIFRIGTDGGPVWVGAAATVEDGNVRVRELMVHSADEYFILSQKTQTRISIRLNGMDRALGTTSGT